MKIELGQKVRDKVTQLEGIAVCRCKYLYGCDHIGIQPEHNYETGTIPPVAWIDVPQIEVIDTKNIKDETKKADDDSDIGDNFGGGRSLGGPGAHPTGKAHPSDAASSMVYG